MQLLCAGAAQGLVKALQPRFDTAIEARFGAVGAMKEALLAGAGCDVMVVTAALVDELSAGGALRRESRAEIGSVATGIAVLQGRPQPDVADATALKAALLAADSIWFPDPERATAGIHFMRVMQQLGVAETLRPRCRPWPDGRTAMREMAAAQDAGAIGCTQVSEINDSPGVELVAVLPAPFGLRTTYAAAVARDATLPQAAARFVALLTGDESLALRRAGGFDV